MSFFSYGFEQNHPRNFVATSFHFMGSTKIESFTEHFIEGENFYASVETLQEVNNQPDDDDVLFSCLLSLLCYLLPYIFFYIVVTYALTHSERSGERGDMLQLCKKKYKEVDSREVRVNTKKGHRHQADC